MDETTTTRRPLGDNRATAHRGVIVKGTMIDGKYRIDAPLGKGGMGQVFSARDTALARDVAIKILQPDLASNPVVVARFQKEARTAAALRSENAVRIYDVAKLPSGTPYIVMEKLVGEDLASYVTRKGALDPIEAVGLIIMACAATEEAHSLGVVHRDLKPGNLFLTHDRHGKPVLKVLDFGLARSVDPDSPVGYEHTVTRAHDVLGSPQFMSPEQVRAPSKVDRRADVYSLGVTLHFLVTGKLPYRSGPTISILAQVLAGPPAPVRTLRPQIPQAIADVIERATKRERDDRYPTAAQLATALAEAREQAELATKPRRATIPPPPDPEATHEINPEETQEADEPSEHGTAIILRSPTTMRMMPIAITTPRPPRPPISSTPPAHVSTWPPPSPSSSPGGLALAAAAMPEPSALSTDKRLLALAAVGTVAFASALVALLQALAH